MPKRSILLLFMLFALIAIVACSNNNDELQTEVDDLKVQLAQAQSSTGSSGPSQAELDSVNAELAMAKEDLAKAEYFSLNGKQYFRGTNGTRSVLKRISGRCDLRWSAQWIRATWNVALYPHCSG